jgi:MFS family permease
LLLFGFLSDRIGRKRLYLIGALASAIWGVPYYFLLDTRLSRFVLGAMIIAGVINDCMGGPQPAFFAEAFPARFRYSGASLAFQLAALTAGGPAPLIATAILNRHLGSLPIGLMFSGYALLA